MPEHTATLQENTSLENSMKKTKSSNTIELLQKEKPPVILQLGKDDKSSTNNNIKINLGVGIGSRQRKESATSKASNGINSTTADTLPKLNDGQENVLSYAHAASNNGDNQPRSVGIISTDKIHHGISQKKGQSSEEEESDQEYCDSQEPDLCNVFVKYLPQHFTDQDLRELFKPYGEIVTCHVMTDKQRDNVSLGFGFVRFSSESEAQAAINGLNEKPIENKRLLCKLSNKVDNKEKDQQSNLFIRNIPPHYDEDKLKSAFEAFGPITKVKIMRDQNTQKSKCYGFCEFEKRSDALTAIQQMNGSKLEDDSSKDILPLVVKFADTEQEKQKRKQKKRQTQHAQAHIPPNALLHMNQVANALANNSTNVNPTMFSYPMYQHPHQMLMNPPSSLVDRRRSLPDDHEIQNTEISTNPYHADMLSHFHHMAYFGHVPPHMQQHLNMPHLPPSDRSAVVGKPLSKTGGTESNNTDNQKRENLSDVRTSNNYMHHGFGNIPYYNPYFNPYTLPPHQFYPSTLPIYDESLPPSNNNDSSNINHVRRKAISTQTNLEKANTDEKEGKSEPANLFIFHLPGDVDDNKLHDLFSKFGDIESVKVIRDSKTNLSKGYGFVKYFSLESAIEAVSQMNGYQLGKKHLKVSFKTDGNVSSQNSANTSASSNGSPNTSNPSSYPSQRAIPRDNHLQKHQNSTLTTTSTAASSIPSYRDVSKAAVLLDSNKKQTPPTQTVAATTSPQVVEFPALPSTSKKQR
ncbi:hypothetical protein C9374_010186 [Naegleria lovaniensis]|uniref:RRM domain-containing protein n=1 Tax=Naegleria lovaniensis TaxID=51637 RepID=A0AA88GCT0_NAELO|nr:uncharacterized protein C9374_010186 [Naegleria lovaniensis]KAG2375182.1 hypothetical protein C9374_010186 [Naegleria lovaniensis]